ncbi:MAG: prephenate dehydrogenase/arogenate dehydrogenase family protein [Methanoregula sp.]|uniref:prephenate dehydrogenase/arogenate dehydrogenase family protein n=1 Tax=Methanoregula sp. TaxID=2052170 RepID=UPI003C75883D
MKAGIIGGTGKMGQLFCPVFERAGYETLVSGRSTALTNEQLAESCDIVIVSVPIRDTVRVIGEIAPVMRDDQLLCDFTSLKVAPVAAMLRSKAQVIGLHPMFGPTVSSIAGQTIVVCPARTTDAALDYLAGIFTREGAVCTLATPEEHDRMMAVVQGLTHFVTICMADTLRRLGTDIGATEAYMSPVYQIELGLVGRLLSQDPALYADILEQNPFVPEVIAACRSAAGDLAEIVTSGDPDAFAEFFRQDTRHLGTYCKRGQDLTDTLIECMVKK